MLYELDCSAKLLYPLQALIRHFSTEPNEIHLLAIGPLTNLAVAFQLDPHIASKAGFQTKNDH